MAISKLSTTASLKQVMDKFEEISLQDFSSINIKVMSSLPSSAKEGDIIILNSYEYTKVIVARKEPNLNNNEIWLSVLELGESNIKSKKIDFISSVMDCKIKINGQTERLNVYEYKNNSFIHLNSDFNIYIAPSYHNENIHGGVASNYYDYSTTAKYNTRKDTDEGIELYINREGVGQSLRNIYTSQKIDLTPYKTVEIKYKVVDASGSNLYIYFFGGVASSTAKDGILATRNSYIAYEENIDLENSVGKELSFNVDISDINTTSHVKITSYVSGSSYYSRILVKSIRLLK